MLYRNREIDLEEIKKAVNFIESNKNKPYKELVYSEKPFYAYDYILNEYKIYKDWFINGSKAYPELSNYYFSYFTGKIFSKRKSDFIDWSTGISGKACPSIKVKGKYYNWIDIYSKIFVEHRDYMYYTGPGSWDFANDNHYLQYCLENNELKRFWICQRETFEQWKHKNNNFQFKAIGDWGRVSVNNLDLLHSPYCLISIPKI